MNNIVLIKNNQSVTDSTTLSKIYNIPHSQVIEKIMLMDMYGVFMNLNYVYVSPPVSSKKDPIIYMTKWGYKHFSRSLNNYIIDQDKHEAEILDEFDRVEEQLTTTQQLAIKATGLYNEIYLLLKNIEQHRGNDPDFKQLTKNKKKLAIANLFNFLTEDEFHMFSCELEMNGFNPEDDFYSAATEYIQNISTEKQSIENEKLRNLGTLFNLHCISWIMFFGLGNIIDEQIKLHPSHAKAFRNSLKPFFNSLCKFI